MYQIKRILVALDQTKNDKTLFRFVSHICSRLKVDKIYFVHVTKTLEWPPEIIEKYPDCLAPIDENIQHLIKEQVSKYLPKELIPDTDILVFEGNPDEILLREVIIKETDLLVMGKKSPSKGTGRLTRRLANLAHCSIALISNSFIKALDSKSKKLKMMVSVDFNEGSIDAANTAKIISHANDAKIVFNHVYHVPSGYHYSGKSFNDFAKIMKKNAEEKMDKLLKKCKIDSAISKQVYTLDTKNNIAKKIVEAAEKEKALLIVVGSKGRTQFASIFLGSTAEKLARYANQNVLIVKDKKHNMNLLDYLKDV